MLNPVAAAETISGVLVGLVSTACGEIRWFVSEAYGEVYNDVPPLSPAAGAGVTVWVQSAVNGVYLD